MAENMHESFYETHHNSSDNEKTSTYSSRDGSCNYDPIFTGRIKSECLQFSDHIEINDGKSLEIDEMIGSLKTEKTVLSLSNLETHSSGPKKRQLFKCSHCTKVFSNSSAIAKHKLTHSDERKYVCDSCGKAFKRQDHLNGHKHTHKTNKPHACHLCDRSYSDARSLRRHYENQHQNEFLRSKEQNVVRRDSGSSSVDESSSLDVFGLLDDTKSIKCDVCNKGFKNQSALNGHMRLHGGYGQLKNSITGPGEPRAQAPVKSENITVIMASQGLIPSSSRLSNMVLITTMPNERTHSQLHSLLTMEPSTISTAQHTNECNSLTQGFSQGLSKISSAVFVKNNLPSIPMVEISLRQSQLSNNQSSGSLIKASNHNSQNTHIHNSSNNTHYSPITPAFSNQNNADSVFNYPTMIDDNNLSFESANREGYPYNWDNTQASYVYATNVNTVDKQWPYYDITEELEIKPSSPPSLPRESSTNNLEDFIMNFEPLDACSNLESEWCKFSDGNDDTNIVAELAEAESIIKKEIGDTTSIIDSCHIYKPLPVQESSLSVPSKKNKSRPAPIFIPPQTSAHMSRLRSPRVWNTTDGKERKIPPYTPPPMLSPQRKGSGLFNSVWYSNNRTPGNNFSSTIGPWTTPLPNKSITVISNSFCKNPVVSITSLGHQQISSVIVRSPVNEGIGNIWLNPHEDPFTTVKKSGEPEHFLYQDECQPLSFEDADGLPTSATPRINIGPQYQAVLPPRCYNKGDLRVDKRECDTLLWDPEQFKDTLENAASLDLLMKIASSPAVKSCGLNMEYTFHLLCKFKGDLEKTLQALLEDSLVVFDYVYAETTNWTTNEINKFQERLKKHDRDFMRVAFDLQSYGMNKSVKACVEFYYVWKQMNNVKDINRYRIKPSRRKLMTVNNNSSHNDDTALINGGLSTSSQAPPESGYNLRKKFPSGNQKVYMSYGSYEYHHTSSDGSSRETSPMAHCKPPRTASNLVIERVKRPQSYHCSQCERKFAKSKAFENHVRSHKGSNLVRDQLLTW